MVTFTHDLDARALYITIRPLADGEHVARTIEIDAGTNADLDADGHLLGIEVLAPGSPWPVSEVMRRWEVSDGDLAMILTCYPNAQPAVSVTW